MLFRSREIEVAPTADSNGVINTIPDNIPETNTHISRDDISITRSVSGWYTEDYSHIGTNFENDSFLLREAQLDPRPYKSFFDKKSSCKAYVRDMTNYIGEPAIEILVPSWDGFGRSVPVKIIVKGQYSKQQCNQIANQMTRKIMSQFDPHGLNVNTLIDDIISIVNK